MARQRPRARRKKQRTKPKRQLIKHHLPKVSNALLQGTHRDRLRTFLKQYEKQGLYALYDEKGALYYVGKASDVMNRLDAHHKKDRHVGKWEALAFYVLDSKVDIHELESMVIAIADPPGNANKGKISGSLKSDLAKFWKARAREELESVLMIDRPTRRSKNQAKKSAKKRRATDKRLTDKKLSNWIDRVGVEKAGKTLDITPGYVSIQRKDLSKFRSWITGAGKKDSVILAIETTRSDSSK